MRFLKIKKLNLLKIEFLKKRKGENYFGAAFSELKYVFQSVFR